ncbi:uncharacterized protein LOC127283179 [Leptopilina boulardi]|uniref:uncharacterized protein LOC127283179 n=1 Tax=Leptopilina boulardi TaxID=63433 RepID=UPI0021F59143|nr:uncharacterized protein LOC127283179 [Leptopilina boulardi]
MAAGAKSECVKGSRRKISEGDTWLKGKKRKGNEGKGEAKGPEVQENAMSRVQICPEGVLKLGRENPGNFTLNPAQVRLESKEKERQHEKLERFQLTARGSREKMLVNIWILFFFLFSSLIATTVSTDTTTVSSGLTGTTNTSNITQVPPFSSAFCTGSNEVYSPNALNLACQPSCSYPAIQTNCPQGYYPGCVCNTFYIRDSNYACILAEACPTTTTVAATTCQANQTYDARAADPTCRPTCQNLSGSLTCSAALYPSCVCAKNYVISNTTTNSCIFITDC